MTTEVAATTVVHLPERCEQCGHGVRAGDVSIRFEGGVAHAICWPAFLSAQA